MYAGGGDAILLGDVTSLPDHTSLAGGPLLQTPSLPSDPPLLVTFPPALSTGSLQFTPGDSNALHEGPLAAFPGLEMPI
jgi:hypothetical protein